MSENINEAFTLSSYPKAIVHIDCDAFFTSCEKARDPTLKDKPVVTGKERGIVSCPSYEAKKCGIKRGMRLGEAKALCPTVIILPSDYETYSIYSENLFSIIRRFTPQVEEFSIDEAFCDLTGLRRLYRTSYAKIALKLKDAIKKELGITASVGLSLSKTLAKICSKKHKPDGFTQAPGYLLHEFLKTVEPIEVCGFGPNTVALLKKNGIRTVFDYAKRPVSFAENLLGKIGIELWHELRGEVVYEVTCEKKDTYLTISKTKTFMPPSNKRDFVKGQLIRNLESAFIKLRRHGLSARNITAYLKRSDFSHSALEARITRHSSSTFDFIGVCAQLFDNLFESGVNYRATGIIISDIVRKGIDSQDLFDDPICVERMDRVSRVIDEVNLAHGKHTVHVAASNIVSDKGEHPRNDRHWRKNELLKGETFRKRLAIPLIKLTSTRLPPFLQL